jgi:hypothetical protein
MVPMMFPTPSDGVDEWFRWLAGMKAIFPVHVVWVELNVSGLPKHPVHVCHLGGEDGGVL